VRRPGRFQAALACQKKDVISVKYNYFVKFLRYACLFDCREEKLEHTQAARALPFPFGRKRKQKGPFRTALRQQENEATIKPVRRTFPNSTIHIVSNTWEGSFLLYGQKSPHEPRSEQSAMLPWPPVSGYADKGRV